MERGYRKPADEVWLTSSRHCRLIRPGVYVVCEGRLLPRISRVSVVIAQLFVLGPQQGLSLPVFCRQKITVTLNCAHRIDINDNYNLFSVAFTPSFFFL